MPQFKFETTGMKGSYLITPLFSEDNRGYFIKDFEKEDFAKEGLNIELQECFESFSYKNVIRGLHLQITEPQTKLVRVVSGEIYDIIVDLRVDSDTFGRWEGFKLSDVNRKSLLVPSGFAHGYSVQSETAIVSYKCAGKYHKGTDSGIIWNDKDLGIIWGIENPIVSERDRGLMTLNNFLNNNRLL